MWKKTAVALLALLLLFACAVVAVPLLFKPQIRNLIEREVNGRVAAEISLGGFGLTLLPNFPDLTLQLEQVAVEGEGRFDGITLAEIGKIEATIDLRSLLRPPVTLERISVVAPKFHLVVLEDGSTNYDIIRGKEEGASSRGAPSSSDGSTDESLRIALRGYTIENAALTYDDRKEGRFLQIEALTHHGEGDLSQTSLLLSTQTSIEGITLRSGGVAWLKRASFEGKCDLRLDLTRGKYAFDENEIRLNGLHLAFDGSVSTGEDGALDLDVTWKTPKTDLTQILSLVPALYARQFASIETGGRVSLSGYAKGRLAGEALPAFGIDLRVEEGMFRYPSLPEKVDAITADLHIENPGGTADGTSIALRRLHLEVAGNPFDLKFLLRHPRSDPEIDAALRTRLDVGKLKRVVPMKRGESYAGTVEADVTLSGRLSTLEKGAYDAFGATGKIVALGLQYERADLPFPLRVDEAQLSFSPRSIRLSPLRLQLGESDLSLSGTVTNYLPFALRGGTLQGEFRLTSHLFDADPFLSGGKEKEEPPPTVIEIPRGIDARLRARIDTLRFQEIEMTKVRGEVRVEEGIADLEELGLKLFGGTLLVTGKYDARTPKAPRFDFALDLKRIDLPSLWQGIETVQKIAPIARNSSGKISTKLRLSGLLDEEMSPRPDSLDGGGTLFTERVTIESSGVLAELASRLDLPSLERLRLHDTRIGYTFRDGRVRVKPLHFKTGDIEIALSGSHGFDQSLDYQMELDLPTTALGSAADRLTSLLGDFGSHIPSRVAFEILISGTTSAPAFKIVPKGTAKDAGKEVKRRAAEEASKARAAAEERAKKEAEKARKKGEAEARDAKARAEARIAKEAEKIRREAKRKAERIRRQSKRAADKVRREGYAAADKIEGQAHDPFSKAAAKTTADRLRKEADAKADKILQEGEKKASEILRLAEEKIARLAGR